MDPLPRAIREATDVELKRTLQDPDAGIVEWPALLQGKTFVASVKTLVIARGTAFGGDAKAMEGGWRYHSPHTLMMDWSEILRTVRATGGTVVRRGNVLIDGGTNA